jgi:hypothetical protein
MGYNANLLKVSNIPSRKAAAGTAISYPVIPATDQRVTIPAIRLRAGAGGGNLIVLQTEAVYRFSLAAKGAVLTIPDIATGLSGRQVIIRYASGETLVSEITAQTGTAITLGTQVEASQSAMLYLLGTETGNYASVFPLTVSGRTTLESACPGVVAGKELGWPVILHLENTDGNEQIEGGTVAFIGV